MTVAKNFYFYLENYHLVPKTKFRFVIYEFKNVHQVYKKIKSVLRVSIFIKIFLLLTHIKVKPIWINTEDGRFVFKTLNCQVLLLCRYIHMAQVHFKQN